MKSAGGDRLELLPLVVLGFLGQRRPPGEDPEPQNQHVGGPFGDPGPGRGGVPAAALTLAAVAFGYLAVANAQQRAPCKEPFPLGRLPGRPEVRHGRLSTTGWEGHRPSVAGWLVITGTVALITVIRTSCLVLLVVGRSRPAVRRRPP